ncbi:threonine synthase [Candidatus Poribacteria bacterium]|nr:threonine synthase [Candidatus Poribacteria bacterium]
MPNAQVPAAMSLWRYREALPINADTDIVTLGEGMTPLVPIDVDTPEHFVKLDYLCPTGSYKDRGAAVLLTHLKALGVEEIVEDSSGNAGAAIAAYSARAGIHCTIYCPESTSQGKLKQISAYGAELKLVPGNRMATTEAVKLAAETTCYASHNWHPFFLEGTKTLAYEIVEQLGWRAPTHVICPVGFGSIYLGLFIGFRELQAHGIIVNMPRLLGVQPNVCCPIYNAYVNKAVSVSRMPQANKTLAEGITAELPIRGHMILEAISATNGAFITVDDTDIKTGLTMLAAKGIYVEPTSAVVVKAYQKFLQAGIVTLGDQVVSILTGIGLKASS